MELTLVQGKSETPDVESFIFQPKEPLSWKAGQYLHYVLHHEPTDDRGSDRWFTVASAPFEKQPMITTRFTLEKGSSFKKSLGSLQTGDSIEISAVDGSFVIEDPSKEYIFIAGGIGITPFHSMLKQADHDAVQLKVTLLYGNRDENVVFKDELDAFAKNNPNLTIKYLVAPQKIDETALAEYVGSPNKPMFYISGPEPMVAALSETIQKMGVEKERIKLDDFPGYPAD